jgi:hypothetical protein
MNCFEARNDFVAFWRNALETEARAKLLVHLRDCPTCDHSFRIFALTAPVLYSATEPSASLGSVAEIAGESGAERFAERASMPEQRRFARYFSKVMPVLVMTAAAAIALLFAAPSRVTFEDAIAAENPNVELASNEPADGFFGQELLAPDDSAHETPGE